MVTVFRYRGWNISIKNTRKFPTICRYGVKATNPEGKLLEWHFYAKTMKEAVQMTKVVARDYNFALKERKIFDD